MVARVVARAYWTGILPLLSRGTCWTPLCVFASFAQDFFNIGLYISIGRCPTKLTFLTPPEAPTEQLITWNNVLGAD